MRFFPLGLAVIQMAGSAVVLAGEGGFKAAASGEGAGVVREGLEGNGSAGGWVDGFEGIFDFLVLAIHFVIERRGFKRSHAVHTPAAGD